MGLTRDFWHGRRVLVTGHTGFKGSWLLLMLERLGAEVTGLALAPQTTPALFDLIGGERLCDHHLVDIRDPHLTRDAIGAAAPQVVIHMAAQPLVRQSYTEPLATLATNVMGTAHVLEACRSVPGLEAIVSVTTDKCYRNDGRTSGYREDDPLGGYDPYSASKAAAELVSASWRDSFLAGSGIGLATARAGNVIGGGDFSADRLVPDALAALARGVAIELRNPAAVRPWQHALEPLAGYLMLAQALSHDRTGFARGWNFGPPPTDSRSVGDVVDLLAALWGAPAGWIQQPGHHPHEAAMLTLDSTDARELLGWSPRLSLEAALELSVTWHRGWTSGADPAALCRSQVAAYLDPLIA